ncbi:MAG: hypothetical protein KGD64_08465 [Candidatus Heimdallarchaeota archaeon]|nr:hypothetical protein [Candidatus Heimdallarchaeota archaeon]
MNSVTTVNPKNIGMIMYRVGKEVVVVVGSESYPAAFIYSCDKEIVK